MGGMHVIIGEDDYLVAEAAKRALGGGGGLEVVDSANASNADLQLEDLAKADESVSTPPFLEPAKATWWKNVRFLPQSGKNAPSADVKEALEAFAKKLAKAAPLPDNQTLVISGPKLLASSVFAKTMKTVADVQIFAEGKPWEKARMATERAVELAGEMGLSFEGGAASDFIARVGEDSRSIASELAKMRDYLGDGAKKITRRDIAEITSQGVGVEPELWAITDALGERNLAKALAAVAPFERESGFAVLVTTVVERFFRTLASLKDAAERGALAEASAGMAPFAAKKNAGFLANWSLLELRRARAEFMNLRERAVSSGDGVDALVVAGLARVCRRAAAPAGRRTR